MAHHIHRLTDSAHAERLLCALEHLRHIETHATGGTSGAKRVECNYLSPERLEPLDKARKGTPADDGGRVRVRHEEQWFSLAEYIHREAILYGLRVGAYLIVRSTPTKRLAAQEIPAPAANSGMQSLLLITLSKQLNDGASENRCKVSFCLRAHEERREKSIHHLAS